MGLTKLASGRFDKLNDLFGCVSAGCSVVGVGLKQCRLVKDSELTRKKGGALSLPKGR